ncbi:MAG: alkaline phosphatase family protein, partial [Candidatus Berkelbacteria bacterium]|nr:alkaline phosphatase family protein [Candidatus Berkelbacteria bacterium]
EPMKIKLEESKTPGVLGKLFKAKEQNTVGTIKPGDNVFFFNIRADRMRQLVQMFTTEMKENGTHSVRNLNIITLTTYDERFPVTVIYPTEKIKNPLAKIISDRGLTQGHFAETEKYAHVTYFFNGGIADPFPKEDWYLIKSPDVATYDLAPEMSASKITDKVIEVLNEKMLDFVLINYANADMVGHTGVLDATIKACEAVDKELRRLIESFPGSTMLVTADHGNADYMFDPVYNEVIKTHSTNPVPFIVVGKKYQYAVLRQSGILADIAPTILSIMEIPTPNTFDGVNLIESNSKEEYEKKEEPKK